MVNDTKRAVLSNARSKVSDSTFFKEKCIATPSKKLSGTHVAKTHFSVSQINRIKIFRHIEYTQPTTRYKLAKETLISYTAVKQIIRDMVFAGVVHEKLKLQTNGKTCKILTIPEVKNE